MNEREGIGWLTVSSIDNWVQREVSFRIGSSAPTLVCPAITISNMSLLRSPLGCNQDTNQQIHAKPETDLSNSISETSPNF